MEVCYNCFEEKQAPGPCPHCGYDETADRDNYPLALKHGAILDGRYIIGRVLGQGGFGITYVAYDDAERKRVAIKEYFPTDFVGRTQMSGTVQLYAGDRKRNFEYGKVLFLEEARNLAQFMDDRSIVRIHRFFEEKNTAYFSMELVEGGSLDRYAKKKGGRLSPEEASRLLLPLMLALDRVHGKGIVHRDIAPDNILVREDGTAVLIDFGAARYSTEEKSRSLDVVVKHGFAPKEQYSRHGRQGPYTDIYALAATWYYIVTGQLPPDSIERIDEDALRPVSAFGVKVNRKTEAVIRKAMSVEGAERYRSMREFHDALKEAMTDGPKPGPRVPKAALVAVLAAVLLAAAFLLVKNLRERDGDKNGAKVPSTETVTPTPSTFVASPHVSAQPTQPAPSGTGEDQGEEVIKGTRRNGQAESDDEAEETASPAATPSADEEPPELTMQGSIVGGGDYGGGSGGSGAGGGGGGAF